MPLERHKRLPGRTAALEPVSIPGDFPSDFPGDLPGDLPSDLP